MLSHIYLNNPDKKTYICSVDLEVVPGGTYVIDGFPYKLVEKPIFNIENKNDREDHFLKSVILVMDKIPLEEFNPFWK
jgi:hypothetical protein